MTQIDAGVTHNRTLETTTIDKLSLSHVLTGVGALGSTRISAMNVNDGAVGRVIFKGLSIKRIIIAFTCTAIVC